MTILNKTAKPFLKWAGGKRQLLPVINEYLPKEFNHYYEPFVGAGAVFFDLNAENNTINDFNSELINTYQVIKDNVEDLIEDLKRHKNEKEYYLHIRSLDRRDDFKDISPVERASRMIYLNKTCFNGLYRVNSKNQYNVPFANLKNPTILNEEVLRDAHYYLNERNVTILTGDFEDAVRTAKEGDFVYMDPPYDLVTEVSFVTYSTSKFEKDAQLRVKKVFDELTSRGCKVMLSNSATDFILETFKEYDTNIVQAKRFINSVSSKRGNVPEVLVTNY